MKIDLHNHSNYSDGLYSVEDLLEKARENNVGIMALTDHDSVYGVNEAIKIGKQLGIEVIGGIELSTTYKNESVHIIGLFKKNIIPDTILNFGTEMKEIRKKRAIDMMKKIEEIYHVNVNYDELLKREVITRGNMFQNIMISNPGISITDANLYVSHNSKAYIEVSKFEVRDGLKFLKENNCITILAHPCLLTKKTVYEIISFGFDGIEAIYPKNEADDELIFRGLAIKNNLFVSAGSDFHGDINHANIGDVSLGEEEFEIIKERLE